MNGQCSECGETGALRFQIDSNCLGYNKLHERMTYEKTVWVCSMKCLHDLTGVWYTSIEDGGENGWTKPKG